MAAVEDGFTYLYEKNCRVNDKFYLEVAPKVFTTYRQALTELSTDNPEVLKKGAVGKINNAYVCVENLLPTGAKYSSYIAFASFKGIIAFKFLFIVFTFCFINAMSFQFIVF